MPSSRRIPWPHRVVSAIRSSPISSNVSDVRERRERHGDRQVVPEPGPRIRCPAARALGVQLGRRASPEDRLRMDETGDRDGVLARPVGAQARCRRPRRASRCPRRTRRRCRAAPARRRRPSRPARRADVEPAGLTQIEALLGRVVDDPAAELEPWPLQSGLDDDAPAVPGGPDRGPDPVHRRDPPSVVLASMAGCIAR